MFSRILVAAAVVLLTACATECPVQQPIIFQNPGPTFEEVSAEAQRRIAAEVFMHKGPHYLKVGATPVLQGEYERAVGFIAGLEKDGWKVCEERCPDDVKYLTSCTVTLKRTGVRDTYRGEAIAGIICSPNRFGRKIKIYLERDIEFGAFTDAEERHKLYAGPFPMIVPAVTEVADALVRAMNAVDE